MVEKQFVWIIRSSSPRKGPKLIQNQVHNTADYPEENVAEWVNTKAAKYVKSKKEKE